MSEPKTPARQAAEEIRNNPAMCAAWLMGDPVAKTEVESIISRHFSAGAQFQDRVKPWLLECFGETIANDTTERNHRFLEESLELVQCCGCTQSEAHQLVTYVFSRPTGERKQECGGVMVTLAALCLSQGIDMRDAGETELTRIWTKVEKIRSKQAAKPKHSPLPAPAKESMERELAEALRAIGKHSLRDKAREVLARFDAKASQRPADWNSARQQLAAKGGQATSLKKKRAARRNATQPRPGRSLFNSAVRFAVEWIRACAYFHTADERILIHILRDKYHFDALRSEAVLNAAKKRL